MERKGGKYASKEFLEMPLSRAGDGWRVMTFVYLQVIAAIKVLSMGVRVIPSDASLLRSLGQLLAEASGGGREKAMAIKAAEMHRRAVRQSPLDAAAHHSLGNALTDLGQSSQAKHHQARAVSLRPDFAPALNNLANALRESGDAAQAAKHLEIAVDLEPSSASYNLNLAATLSSLSRHAQAASYFRAAIKVRIKGRGPRVEGQG